MFTNNISTIIGSENYVIEVIDLNKEEKTIEIMLVPKEDSLSEL